MITLILLAWSLLVSNPDTYKTSNGLVRFESNATQENIIASSTHLRGVFNYKTGNFSFAIRLNSFQGFNSALQQEHYNENYVESEQYKEATFKGKIVEDISWQTGVSYEVRAKGEFELHGVKKIETIRASIKMKDEQNILITARFNINLSDYQIRIPRIVHKKLSENIEVSVQASMQKNVN